jgi:nicotinamidase-related amidase
MEAPFSWREVLTKHPVWAADFELDIERTALVIVDMQNVTTCVGYSGHRFLSTGYPEVAAAYFRRVDDVVLPNIERLLTAFRERQLRVVHLTVGSHLPDGTDFEPLRRSREDDFEEEHGEGSVLSSVGSEPHAIHPRLMPQAGELVLNKVSRSAFASTGIDQVLRNMGITGLIFTGVATNACVAATAEDAGDRGYRGIIVEDATASTNLILHESALLNFASLYGRVMASEELLDLLDRRPAEQALNTR